MHCYACKRLIGICPNRIKLCPTVAQQTRPGRGGAERGDATFTDGNGMKTERRREGREAEHASQNCDAQVESSLTGCLAPPVRVSEVFQLIVHVDQGAH